MQCATVPVLPKKEPGLLLVFHVNNYELVCNRSFLAFRGGGSVLATREGAAHSFLIAYSVVSLVIVF